MISNIFISRKKAFSCSLTALAVSALIAACGGGGSEYAAVDCTGKPEPGKVDCRNANAGGAPSVTASPAATASPVPASVTPTAVPSGGTAPTTVSPTPVKPPVVQYSDIIRDAGKLVQLSVFKDVSWQPSHSDQDSRDLLVRDKVAVVASKWHNHLRSIKLSGGTPSLNKDTLFADVSGGRYAVDAVSGASEQVLQDVKADEAGKTLVVQVKKYGSSSKDTGVGMYVSRSADAGALTRVPYASQQKGSFFSMPDIQAQAVSGDGLLMAAGAESGRVVILDRDLTEKLEKKLDFKVDSMAFSGDKKMLFVGGKKQISLFSSEGITVALDVASLSELWRSTFLDNISQIEVLNSGAVLVQPEAGNAVYILHLKKKSGEKPGVQSIASAGTVTDVAVSPNKEVIAISTTGKVIDVVNIVTGKRASVKRTDSVAALAIDNQGNLWSLEEMKLISFRIPASVNDM